MVHWPLPGTMRTRAMACLRRPVAAPGPEAAGLRASTTGVSDSLVYSVRSGASALVSSSAGVGVGARVVLDGFLHSDRQRSRDGRLHYCATCEISKGTGFWAWCGCVSPPYTFSLDSCWRAIEFLGSMPRTAVSTAFSGALASSSWSEIA